MTLGRDRRERPVGDHAGAGGEPVDGVGAVAAGDGDDEVDGVAAVVAGPAAPAFVAVSVAEHGDRGVVVVVVGHRAVPPAARPDAAGRLGEFVEQRGEVGAVEHVVDRPAGVGVTLPRSPSGATIAWSVSNRRALVAGRARSARRRSGHRSRQSARPWTSWPSQSRSRSVRSNSSAAAAICSGGWRSSTRVWMSDSSPAAIFADGGAVVGLGGEVGGPVADQHGGDAVGAGQLQRRLEVAGAVADRGPRLVDHLDRPPVAVGRAARRRASGWRRPSRAGGRRCCRRRRTGRSRRPGPWSQSTSTVVGPSNMPRSVRRRACRARTRPAPWPGPARAGCAATGGPVRRAGRGPRRTGRASVNGEPACGSGARSPSPSTASSIGDSSGRARRRRAGRRGSGGR